MYEGGSLMSEEKLNIQYICDKTLLSKDDELVPIILEMIKDSYKSGLNQAEYDNNMDLINENEKLNHYKLLYQKVKERNTKAIEYINAINGGAICREFNIYLDSLLEILRG